MQQPAFFDGSLQSEAGAKRSHVDQSSNFSPLQIFRFSTTHADRKFEFQTFANALPVSLFRHLKIEVAAG